MLLGQQYNFYFVLKKRCKFDFRSNVQTHVKTWSTAYTPNILSVSIFFMAIVTRVRYITYRFTFAALKIGLGISVSSFSFERAAIRGREREKALQLSGRICETTYNLADTFESYVRIQQFARTADSRVYVTQLATLEITAGTRYYMHRSCTRVHLYSRSRRPTNNSYIPTWRATPPRVFAARALMHTYVTLCGRCVGARAPCHMNIGRPIDRNSPFVVSRRVGRDPLSIHRTRRGDDPGKICILDILSTISATFPS